MIQSLRLKLDAQVDVLLARVLLAASLQKCLKPQTGSAGERARVRGRGAARPRVCCPHAPNRGHFIDPMQCSIGMRV